MQFLYIDPCRLFAFVCRLFAFVTDIFVGVVGSVNGVTKSKLLTVVSAWELRQADETADVKKMSAAKMIDIKYNSPAQEFKRGLALEGSHGAKSNRKGKKRQR